MMMMMTMMMMMMMWIHVALKGPESQLLYIYKKKSKYCLRRNLRSFVRMTNSVALLENKI